MKRSQLLAVMKKYGAGWETRDATLLLSCFTKNGIYQESPLAKPYVGHAAIKKYWDSVVVRSTSDIHFTLGACTVSADGRTGYAEWECRNTFRGRKHRMAGIMILTMRGTKITYLNEYWRSKSCQ